MVGIVVVQIVVIQKLSFCLDQTCEYLVGLLIDPCCAIAQKGVLLGL